MTLSLSKFNATASADEGATCELDVFTADGWEPAFLDCDAKEPKKRLSINLLGAASDKAKKYLNAEIRKERAKAKGKKQGDDDFDLAELVEQKAKRAAALTTGWANIPDEKGGLLEFSEKAAYEIYIKYDDIRSQVINFIDDRANFIKS